MLASLPGLLHRGIMAGFAVAPLPFRFPELPMYLVWHRRHHDDPAHRWLRGELEQAAKEAMAAVKPRRAD
jgi:DNA-binding transcriptional LysR family regulator